MSSFPLRTARVTTVIAWSRHGVTPTIAVAMLALLAVAGTMAGCAVVTAQQASGAMNINIEIQYFQQGRTHVAVGFSDAKLNPIEFVSGETVACNDQFLRYSAGQYIGDVPQQPSSGVYTITYTPARGTTATGSSAPISLPVKVVFAPVIVTAPRSGATVSIPSTAPLLISYQPSTLDSTRISALAADGRGHFTFTLPEVESGTIAMPADNFTTFQGSPGILTITRETTNTPSGTPFRSATVHFKNITQVAVVWQ